MCINVDYIIKSFLLSHRNFEALWQKKLIPEIIVRQEWDKKNSVLINLFRFYKVSRLTYLYICEFLSLFFHRGWFIRIGTTTTIEREPCKFALSKPFIGSCLMDRRIARPRTTPHQFRNNRMTPSSARRCRCGIPSLFLSLSRPPCRHLLSVSRWSRSRSEIPTITGTCAHSNSDSRDRRSWILSRTTMRRDLTERGHSLYPFRAPSSSSLSFPRRLHPLTTIPSPPGHVVMARAYTSAHSFTNGRGSLCRQLCPVYLWFPIISYSWMKGGTSRWIGQSPPGRSCGGIATGVPFTKEKHRRTIARVLRRVSRRRARDAIARPEIEISREGMRRKTTDAVCRFSPTEAATGVCREPRVSKLCTRVGGGMKRTKASFEHPSVVSATLTLLPRCRYTRMPQSSCRATFHPL